MEGSGAAQVSPAAAGGLEPIVGLAEAAAGLELLLLFGSRARGEVHAHSDWDFGYIAGERFDPDDLLARLTLHLDSDDVDLVDLDRAGGVLRFRAAAEGRVLYAATAGVFERFWFEAVSFWCDAGPLIRQGQEAVLARLDR